MHYLMLKDLDKFKFSKFPLISFFAHARLYNIGVYTLVT